MRKYGKLLLVLGVLAANSAWVSADGFRGPRPAQPRSTQRDINQQKAEQVAQALKKARLNGYDLEVEVRGDAVKLDGKIRDVTHRALADTVCRQVAGINRIQNNLKYVPSGEIQQTAGTYSDSALRPANYNVVEGSGQEVQQVHFQRPTNRTENSRSQYTTQRGTTQQQRPVQQRPIQQRPAQQQTQASAQRPQLTPPQIVMPEEKEVVVERSYELIAASRPIVPAKPAEPDNQEVAQMIADSLSDAGLGDSDIEVRYQDGLVTLLGGVATAEQRQAAGLAASRVSWVTDVRNQLQLSGPIAQTAFAPQNRVSPVSMHMVAPAMNSGMPGAGGPTPIAGAGVGVYSNPQLPSHAWPAYAAYPNSAAIQYPTQHSASAFPYIGPFYPYPQVPLGWREVSLQWDDGFWQLDFEKKHDAWYWLWNPKNWHN
ncbi:MAG: BON domain-containing protein [Planctomycetaceae bacterium]